MDLQDPDKSSGSGTSKGAGKAPKTASTPPSDRDLKSRLLVIFTRFAESAEERGDIELAEILKQDKDIMAGGLVAFTRPFKALRTPLVGVLAIAEPVIAFQRLGRLMLGRMLMRRRTTDVTPGD